ncbi:HAD hydrolase-like protein [Myxococcota bacterium]|nr:HAD hydrolase-like protein [Myxococcota bacterium]
MIDASDLRAPLAVTSVVFDLDGTLVDSLLDIASAVNDVLGALGHAPRPLEEVRTMIGHGAAVLLQRALGASDPALLTAARAEFARAYGARLVDRTRPYPGIPELLTDLAARGFELAIATNKPAAFTGPMVAALGLGLGGVVGVASSDETGTRKPDPSVVHLALDRARPRGGAPAVRRIAYVGDMAVDVDTARAVPCAAVGVAWGFDPVGCKDRAPDRWVRTVDELAMLFR